MAERTNFPFEITKLDPEREARLKASFRASSSDSPGKASPNIMVGPKRWCFYESFQNVLVDIYNLPLRPSDVFVASYPRSGTTLTQELVWLVANDLDYARAKAIPLTDRYPFIEEPGFFSKELKDAMLKKNAGNEERLKAIEGKLALPTQFLADAPSPRFIKTHLPLQLLPPSTLDTCKVVYVARDPRDVAISYYHFQKDHQISEYTADFKTFFEQLSEGMILLSPILEHVKEFWQMRNHPNLLFLFYEDLLKDMDNTLRRVCEFFGKKYTDDQLDTLKKHLSFESFRENAAVDTSALKDIGIFKPVNIVVRKGKSGGWHEYFDEDLSARAQRWMSDAMRGSGIDAWDYGQQH